jgi:hypothetical protein
MTSFNWLYIQSLTSYSENAVYRNFKCLTNFIFLGHRLFCVHTSQTVLKSLDSGILFLGAGHKLMRRASVHSRH